MSIEDLVAISRYYGSNPEYVVAGGGNTSFKQGATLFIKGSGASLADITGAGFVQMDRDRLAQIWEKSYPSHNAEREAAVLADLMASRKPGEEQKRPSVETLLHDILPFNFVVHTHPAVVNGLTCSVKGEKAAAELFGTDALWIPSTNPGYILSLAVKNAMTAYKAVQGRYPSIIFLQNHGVFVGADSTDGIKNLYQRIMDTIGARITEKPDFSNHTAEYGASAELPL
jgi:rhamnose utilization protein RhaD (predicted bifunctional aldolase and dehydrogenase)